MQALWHSPSRWLHSTHDLEVAQHPLLRLRRPSTRVEGLKVDHLRLR